MLLAVGFGSLSFDVWTCVQLYHVFTYDKCNTCVSDFFVHTMYLYKIKCLFVYKMLYITMLASSNGLMFAGASVRTGLFQCCTGVSFLIVVHFVYADSMKRYPPSSFCCFRVPPSSLSLLLLLHWHQCSQCLRLLQMLSVIGIIICTASSFRLATLCTTIRWIFLQTTPFVWFRMSAASRLTHFIHL